jgi:hypothetical protein
MNIDQIKKLNEKMGGGFFSKENMSLFDSHVFPEVVTINAGWLFVTSESDEWIGKRFSVRFVDSGSKTKGSRRGLIFSIPSLEKSLTLDEAYKKMYTLDYFYTPPFTR